MILSHKIALHPNNKQAAYFAEAAGTARFAYNWALAEWGDQYQAWKADNSLPRPSHFDIKKKLNSIKRSQFPWMFRVTKCAPERAIQDLNSSFKNFWEGNSKYPKFKKKGVSKDSFYISNDQFKVENKRIKIPKLGWVRMREALRFPTGKIMSATVSRTANRWFVSISVDIPDSLLPTTESQGVVGVDLGITSLATYSTGKKVEGPKPLNRMMNRLRRLQRSLSRKVKGSKNRYKARMNVAKMHARIADVRRDALHKLTTDLTSNYSLICIEDLNVKGMMKNRHLSKAISDMGFFEFRRQLEYKAKMRGGQVYLADRFYPSSKTCSSCGFKLDQLPLAQREWSCPSCKTNHDRDTNAAINLKNLAVGSTVIACGEVSAGCRLKTATKLTSMKQEASIVNEK